MSIVAPLRSNDETSEQAHTGERNADTALAQKASRGRSRMPSGFENTWWRVEAKALARSVTNDFESYVKLNKRVPPEVVGVVRRIEDYAELADTQKEKKRSTTRFAPPSSARLRFQRLIVPPPLCRTSKGNATRHRSRIPPSAFKSRPLGNSDPVTRG